MSGLAARGSQRGGRPEKIKKAVWRRVNPHGLAEEETSLGLCMEQTYSATDLRAALQTNRSAPCTDYSLFPAAGLCSQRLSGSPRLYACFFLLRVNPQARLLSLWIPSVPRRPHFCRPVPLWCQLRGLTHLLLLLQLACQSCRQSINCLLKCLPAWVTCEKSDKNMPPGV